MVRKQLSLFLIIGFIAFFSYLAFSSNGKWSVISSQSIPESLSPDQLAGVLDHENISHKINEQGDLEVPGSNRTSTELLLTGLRAIQNLQDDHSSEEIVGELVVQQYLKRKMDTLLNQLVGKENYISDIYVPPTHSSLVINKKIKPSDLVTYFLNSPGIKRVYFRLVIDSDAISKQQLDPDFIKARVIRHLRSLLHDLKGVRLIEEVTFVPFHGTGLSSIAASSAGESSEEQWVSRLLVPLLVAFALVITWLFILLLRKSRQDQTHRIKEQQQVFNPDIESISFHDDQDDLEGYIQLDTISPGVIESFTDSYDIGNLLLFLHPKEAANFLQMLPFEQQVKSIGECIGFHNLDIVERERVIKKVSAQLEIVDKDTTMISRSSVKHVAKILNHLKPANSKRILQELHQIDALSLVRLKNEFFVLTSLLPLGVEGIKFIFNEGGSIDLLLAVHDSDSPIKEKVIHLAPEGVRSKLSGDINKIDPEKIQAAQLRIAKSIIEFERQKMQNKKHFQKIK
jgi:hypothetical protein